MKELDVDAILGQLDNPQVGKNAMDVMDMLQEVNKILGEFQKTSRMLDTMGLKPLLVRAAGMKMGIDAESPLACDMGIQPATDEHEEIYKRLNQLSTEEISAIPEAINQMNLDKQQKEIEDDDDEE